MVMTKESIDMEIITWMKYDVNYVLTLIAMALSEGLITTEEAEIAKSNLEQYWKNNPVDDDEGLKKKKVYMNVMKEVGFIITKVLYELVEQLPTYYVEKTTFIPHEDGIMKKLKIPSIDYYSMINILVEKGFIEKVWIKKPIRKKAYSINFDRLNEYDVDV